LFFYAQALNAKMKCLEEMKAGMLPLGLFSLRWNIEISYYETKTFWSFRDYMVRSVEGIERKCKKSDSNSSGGIV